MADERVLRQARAVWRGAIDRDDAFASAARERRLAQRLAPPPERAVAPGAIPWQAVAMGALIAVSGWVMRGRPAVVAAPTGADAAAVAPAVTHASTASRDTPPLSIGSGSGDAPPTLVALAPCFGCRRAGSEASGTGVGERLVPGERVQVPVGSVLILCWGIEAGAGSELDVSGPATVVVTSSGRVVVEPAQPARPPGTPIGESARAADRPAEGAIPLPAWDAQWRAVQMALRGGDRAAAEHRLQVLLALSSVPPAMREQASFALAELELARGATDGDAQARLEALHGSSDAALAADAVFLEARAAGSARERAAVYARYAASAPPSPYRERALVDEGLALLEVGDVEGARARASALRAGGPVPEVVAAALGRLEQALAATEAGLPGRP
jgi:hypothetical protein